MKHPTIVNANANANLRLNQMMQDAENHRRMKRVAAQKPGGNFFSELKEHIPVLRDQRLDESVNSPA